MANQAIPYDRPLPAMEGLAGEFYGWCKQGELRFQCCKACGTFRHVPRETCAECNSFDAVWARSTGRGIVYSWTVVERALHPAFTDSTPMAPVVVEMEEGVRLLSEVVDCRPDELEIGMPVKVEFAAVTDEISLPRFHRLESA